MEIREIITAVFLALGCFLILVGSVGVLRFPDFYSRMHAVGKTDTLGQAFILMGLVAYEGLSMVSVKLLMIVFFMFMANPVTTHALAKAAYVAGHKPWERSAKASDYTSDEEEGPE